LILLQEAVLWYASEIAAGRVGRYGLSFPGYLSTKILEQRLTGYRLETVLLFLLHRCVQDGNFKCLDILTYRHSESLPLYGVDNRTLGLLWTYYKRQPYVQDTIAREAVDREIRRRAEAER
jgi:hypothetical protein